MSLPLPRDDGRAEYAGATVFQQDGQSGQNIQQSVSSAITEL